jgi:dethiobiotin synthetase
MQGLFITATDTGVGKTEVTAAIARRWRREGRSFAVCKPVATGPMDDTRRLALAAGDADLGAITPFVFAEPAAPPVAARLEGRTLTLGELSEAVLRRRERADAVLVEGVGGLLCPLTDTETVADLVGRLGLGMVVVARRGLGTLNHTLLTLEVARRRGLRVCGVVVNETAPVEGAADRANVEELSRRLVVPVLAVIPYRRGGYQEEIPAMADVDWWSLTESRI